MLSVVVRDCARGGVGVRLRLGVEFELDLELELFLGGVVIASLQRAICESRSCVLKPFLQDKICRALISELIFPCCGSSVAISEAMR